MKVLVTGGAGFIGSHIVDKLVAEKNQVVVVDNLLTGKRENINKSATFYRCDITNIEDLNMVFRNEKPEYVIHHAAQISVHNSLSDPYKDASINVLGTINLLNSCLGYDVKKIIYASSAAVYGNPEYLPIDENHNLNPLSPYGISKHTPEHYIKMYSELNGLDYSILRYSNVYGSRQDPQGEGGVISVFIDNLLRGEPIVIFGDGKQTRDFIYVEDIADANIAALYGGSCETFNISNQIETSVNDLLMILNGINKSCLQPTYKSTRLGDIKNSYLCNKKALEQLKWHPEFSLCKGLELTLHYYTGLYQSDERKYGTV